eukprot:GHUV01030449.1.p1 GENE.GHUV01030449.1~~GHUV01030449.1.p1  ORF type:complete len:143 (-),score=2.90 GHUV01030449.1:1213-1641(-)
MQAIPSLRSAAAASKTEQASQNVCSACRNACCGSKLSAEQLARRAGMAAVLAGAVAVHSLLSPLQSDALTPYEESKRMVYGPTADGSIRGCPSNVSGMAESASHCSVHKRIRNRCLLVTESCVGHMGVSAVQRIRRTYYLAP